MDWYGRGDTDMDWYGRGVHWYGRGVHCDRSWLVTSFNYTWMIYVGDFKIYLYLDFYSI